MFFIGVLFFICSFLMALDPDIEHASPNRALEIAEQKRLAGGNLGVLGASIMDRCRRTDDITQAISLARWNIEHNPASREAMVKNILPRLNATKILSEKSAIARFLLLLEETSLEGMGKLQFFDWMNINKKRMSRLKDWKDLERFKACISNQTYFEPEIVDAKCAQDVIQAAEKLIGEGISPKDVLVSMRHYLQKESPIEDVINVSEWMLKSFPTTEYIILRSLLDKIIQPSIPTGFAGDYAQYVLQKIISRIRLGDVKGVKESDKTIEDKTIEFVRWFDSNPHGYGVLEPSSWTILRQLRDALTFSKIDDTEE